MSSSLEDALDDEARQGIVAKRQAALVPSVVADHVGFPLMFGEHGRIGEHVVLMFDIEVAAVAGIDQRRNELWPVDSSPARRARAANHGP